MNKKCRLCPTEHNRQHSSCTDAKDPAQKSAESFGGSPDNDLHKITSLVLIPAAGISAGNQKKSDQKQQCANGKNRGDQDPRPQRYCEDPQNTAPATAAH
jgi:hypothetical protein